MSCNYSIDKCTNKQETDCLKCIKETAEAKYWISWAREYGSSSWYAQKMKLIRIRGNENVKHLIKNMEKLRHNL